MTGDPSPLGKLARLLLPVGWLLAAVGYCGPWIAHTTAALTLTGPDMGEFVKFLPGVQDGSLVVIRQFLYLPPLAVVLGVALLVGSRSLRYCWPLRVVTIALSLPVSLQLLPPAWSPASLVTAEFHLQPIALGICWLSLAGFWVLGRLPIRLAALTSFVLALLAGGLSTWQFLVVRPAIDAVYHMPPAHSTIGWGFILCQTGLAVMAAASVTLAVLARDRQS